MPRGGHAWARVIEEARVIRRILGHLGLPTAVPAARAARSPPSVFDRVDDEAVATTPSLDCAG